MSKLLSKKSKQPEGKTWLHAPEAFTQGAVVYSLKLLGHTEVAQAKGTDVVREAITKVKFANHIKKSEAGIKGSKLRKVDLKISVDTVKIEDTKTKEELYSYPLHRISYCADDKRNKKLFAFIAKEMDSPQHFCFVLESERLAEELTLTVGQAFDIAYRKFLERRGQKDVNAQKQLTDMQEQIKAAEAEKEALKQKIAQLEMGPQGSKGQAFAENNINVMQNPEEKVDNNDFSLLRDFSFGSKPVAVLSQDPNEAVFDPLTEFAGTPQEAPPQNSDSAGFDPFAEFAGTSQEAPPQNSDSAGFDPFAAPPQPQPVTQTPPQVRSNPFAAPIETGEPAPVRVANPHPVALPRRKPPTSAASSFALPPPPTKQSVKASQRQVRLGGGPSPVSPNPAPQSPASADLFSLDTGGSASNSNPFPTDPFADIFDPLDTNPTSNGTSGNGFEEIQEGFARGLVIDHNVFTTTDA